MYKRQSYRYVELEAYGGGGTTINLGSDLVVIEPESNGDPVLADFTGAAVFVAQYDDA